jgi:hypothetical protein
MESKLRTRDIHEGIALKESDLRQCYTPQMRILILNKTRATHFHMLRKLSMWVWYITLQS